LKRHPALWLTMALAVFYVVLANGRIQRDDGETMFQVTRAMAEQGRLDLAPGILPPAGNLGPRSTDTELAFVVAGREGRSYSKYGLGQSLAALPLYWMGTIWQALTGSVYAPRLASSLLNSLLTACSAGVLLILVRALGYSKPSAALVALIFALCTPAWAYTHTFFSEPLVTLCLMAATLGAVRFARDGRTHWFALIRRALGLAVLARIDAIIACPAYGLYILLRWRTRHTPLPRIARQIAAGTAAAAAGIGAVAGYNLARFGSLLVFGYRTSNWETPFFLGLYGLTLSPGKGLLWYTPPVSLGLAGVPRFARRFPAETLLSMFIVSTYVVFYSLYAFWAGGWCWGPRHLLPILPFLLLPSAPILAQNVRHQAKQAGIALLLVLGFIVQFPAVGADYKRALQNAYEASAANFYNRTMFQPAPSPLLGQWHSLLEVTANLRDSAARTQLAAMLAEAQPGDMLPVSTSPAEAQFLVRQAILAFHLPDLWLVTRAWLQGVPTR
jgi:hypothetical protein